MQALIQRAETRGLTLPPYRTQTEFAEWVARAEAALAPKAAATVSAPLLAELNPDDAAAQFLAWLRLSFGPETERSYGSDELADAYANFCTETHRTPTPENIMRAALALQPGVAKRQRNCQIGGKRQRVFVWSVASVPASVSGKTETKPKPKSNKPKTQPLQRRAA